jgi:hypothetical protein
MSLRWCRLSLFATLALAREADACSMIYAMRLHFWPNAAMMIAAPTSDSIFAGPGKVKMSLHSGHNGPVYPREIYGQVMRVDSATGPGARSSSRVVLVPWDYDPGCTPAPWGNSFLWRRLGARGLYTATLRDSAHWAAGLPTYDVFLPETQPYTDRPGGGGAISVVSSPGLMTPEELFGVARGFRTVTTRKEVEDADTAMFFWAELHPSIAKRSPLAEALSFAGYDRWRIRDVVLPTRGTYRVTYTLGQEKVTFYARTDAKPNDFWDGAIYLAPGNVETKLAADGFFVTGWNSADTTNWDAGKRTLLDWAIARDPVATDRRTTVWKGALEPNRLPGGLGSDDMKNALSQMHYMLEARFTVRADGHATFEHRSQLPDGRALVILGTRISFHVY